MERSSVLGTALTLGLMIDMVGDLVWGIDKDIFFKPPANRALPCARNTPADFGGAPSRNRHRLRESQPCVYTLHDVPRLASSKPGFSNFSKSAIARFGNVVYHIGLSGHKTLSILSTGQTKPPSIPLYSPGHARGERPSFTDYRPLPFPNKLRPCPDSIGLRAAR